MLVSETTLLLGDCLERMKEIPDGSVDLVLTDPPYGTVNWSSPHTWDRALPMADLWAHYWRVLKPLGVVCIFGNEPFSTLLKSSSLAHYKYDWVWRKSKKGGFANAKVKPLKEYELVMVFLRGTTAPGRNRNMPYYPQGLMPLNKVVKNSGKSRLGMTVRAGARSEYIQEWTNYPSDILEFESVSKAVHPTQKPVPLLEYLIRTYSREGEVVLDNTMGVGSTGIACVNTSRRFIGIERDETYFQIASELIEAVKPPFVAPLPLNDNDPTRMSLWEHVLRMALTA